jgi:adenylate cyclase
MSFLRELKRRNVFRVAAVYLALAWLIAQIISVVNAPLHLPEWFSTVAIVLLGIGFPIALVLAWAFELTPDGVKRASDIENGPSDPVSTGRKVDFAIIAILVIALGLALWDRQSAKLAESPAPQTAAAAQNSIAVLPFVNLSSDPEQEYFSDGLSEEILDQLAQIKGLRVAGRTSSFLFKDKASDFKTIGATLGVNQVLEGSVRKAGSQLRITAQLINVSDGYHVWSKTYDRTLDDVFAIQEDIAMQVADALSLTLGVSANGPRYAGTDNFEAYDHFLRGRPYWQIDPLRAIAEMEKAAAVDPSYALAWAWESLAYGQMALRTVDPEKFETYFEKMETTAQRAVELGPDEWQCQNALVWALFAKKEWLGADQAFRRAVELSRESGGRMTFEYSSYLVTFGRYDEAIRSLYELRDADPLSREISSFLQNALVIAGRYQEAADEQHRIGIDPDAFTALVSLGFPWQIQQGRKDLVKRFLSSSPTGTIFNKLGTLLDMPSEALSAIREWQKSPGFKARMELAQASHYAGYFGDTELAASLSRDAYFTKGWGLYFVMWDPTLSETRKTPAFKQFLRDLGFVELWRKTGEWNDYCHPVGSSDFECI